MTEITLGQGGGEGNPGRRTQWKVANSRKVKGDLNLSGMLELQGAEKGTHNTD